MKNSQKWPKVEFLGKHWENRVEIAWSDFLFTDIIATAASDNIFTIRAAHRRAEKRRKLQVVGVVVKPGRFTLFLNNTNTNAILLSIGTIPIQYNTMQYLSVLTTIHPNIRISTV